MIRCQDPIPVEQRSAAPAADRHEAESLLRGCIDQIASNERLSDRADNFALCRGRHWGQTNQQHQRCRRQKSN
jgi:hypothetical protein